MNASFKEFAFLLYFSLTWGSTGSALSGQLQYKNGDFDLCFVYSTSVGLYVEDKNNNNRRFNVTQDGTCKCMEVTRIRIFN